MIKYAYKKDTLEVSGHALYAKHGEDIVCASVSTAIILSSNLITRFKLDDHIEVVIKEGYFKLKIIKPSQTVIHIVDNLVWTLDELLEQYPKHIKKEWLPC